MVRQRFTAFDAAIHVFLILFAATILFPFVYVIGLSLSTAQALYTSEVFFWPNQMTVEGYRRFFSMDFVHTGYLVTVFRTAVGTAASLLVQSLAAYALSKRYLPHRNIYTTILIIPLFFGGGLIPTFLMVKGIGLLDSIWVFVFFHLVQIFHMLILRNFFMGIPEELEDSARIDGASDLLIFFRIVLPLSTAAIATVGLWEAVMHWNAWFDSLIYITSEPKHVINVHIRRLVIEQQEGFTERMIDSFFGKRDDQPTPETIRAAAIIVTLTPIMLVYPFIQKYFVKGVVVGSLKG